MTTTSRQRAGFWVFLIGLVVALAGVAISSIGALGSNGPDATKFVAGTVVLICGALAAGTGFGLRLPTRLDSGA